MTQEQQQPTLEDITIKPLGAIAKAAFVERLGQASPLLQSDNNAAWNAAAIAVAKETAKLVWEKSVQAAERTAIVLRAFDPDSEAAEILDQFAAGLRAAWKNSESNLS